MQRAAELNRPCGDCAAASVLAQNKNRSDGEWAQMYLIRAFFSITVHHINSRSNSRHLDRCSTIQGAEPAIIYNLSNLSATVQIQTAATESGTQLG
jgi:hypothetical protein